MRRRGEIVIWWVVLLGVWLASLNAFSYAELATAAALALPCAFAARAARIAARGQWRLAVRGRSAVHGLRFLPMAILHDTVSVLRLALGRDRPEDDSFDEVELRGEQALATIMVSTAPGSVVIDAGADHLLVHRLPIGETRLTEAVRK
ncbi:MAG TPA: Na+/H+ antiporter subunit E [Pseudonocardiaceae bacterium]|jgi:multisubunit Na+/H+ antiporter MnhE subunit